MAYSIDLSGRVALVTGASSGLGAQFARALSAAGGTAAAQVGFGSDGDVLVVTERATNRLTSWRVGHDGRLGAPVITASAGITPFGFAFDRRNRLFVSEAAGGAAHGSTTSSYRFDDDAPARPLVVSPAVATTQTAACWLVVTANGRYAYTANAGSSSVSSFHIGKGGERVARIEPASPPTAPTGSELDRLLAEAIPPLSVEEAACLDADIRAARGQLDGSERSWD